jgi:WD40 repeat protein
VRLFDQNKLVKEFKAHDGPVMSASLVSNYNYFFTCGHDGFVKLWDIRKCETVLNILSH